MCCLPFMGLHENSPLRDIKLFGRRKNRDLLFLPRTLVDKDEHVHPTLLALWKYHALIQELSPGGGGGPKKTLITFLGISWYQWFILRKTIFIRFQRGSNILQGRGSKFFQGGGANVNIELVNFQERGSGPLVPRMRMIGLSMQRVKATRR